MREISSIEIISFLKTMEQTSMGKKFRGKDKAQRNSTAYKLRYTNEKNKDLILERDIRKLFIKFSKESERKFLKRFDKSVKLWFDSLKEIRKRYHGEIKDLSLLDQLKFSKNKIEASRKNK